MRIAWIGGATGGGGVGGLGRDLLRGLLGRGHEVVVFALNDLAEVAAIVLDGMAEEERGRLRVVSRPARWEWGRWYSRHPMTTFVSSFWARKRAYGRLVRDVVAEHRRRPFDVLVQFSQIELFGLRRHLGELPPLVLFPCVHAAGELRWHRRESRYARQSEPAWRHWLVRMNLMHRSWLQAHSARAAAGVIGMSRRFNELIADDYGVRTERQAVVYQPVDRVVCEDDESERAGTVRLLSVGRISVRKGVDLIVPLSHRLSDLAGKVELEVVGAPSFWSDYSRHLRNLSASVAKWRGAAPHADVLRAMARADVLVVPSRYEPGGIVVAEALARGCVVVASDEVGSAEPVEGAAIYRFRDGDLDDLERAVRAAVGAVRLDSSAARRTARSEAARCFNVIDMICRLETALRNAAKGVPIGSGRIDTVGRNLLPPTLPVVGRR